MCQVALNLSIERGLRCNLMPTEVVPAPRLELGTGHDNVANLRCIISAALEEIERGQTRHAKSILNTLKEVLL